MFPCSCGKWREGKGEGAMPVYDRRCVYDVRDGLPEGVTPQLKSGCE